VLVAPGSSNGFTESYRLLRVNQAKELVVVRACYGSGQSLDKRYV